MATNDGGPAFPQHILETRDGAIQVSYDVPDGDGMSLRAYFAGQALAGVLRYPAIERTIEIASSQGGDEAVNAQLARICCNLADALLAELAK